MLPSEILTPWRPAIVVIVAVLLLLAAPLHVAGCATLQTSSIYRTNCTTTTKIGTKCIITCGPNHILSGSTTVRQCLRSGTRNIWVPATAWPTCRPACPVLSLQARYRHNCTSRSVGSSCVIGCATGYVGGTLVNRCVASGSNAVWTGRTLPSCSPAPNCPAITLTTQQKSLYTTTCTSAKVNSVCTIGCNRAAYDGGTVTYRCTLASGKAAWVQVGSAKYPTCKAIQCSTLALSAAQRALYTHTCGTAQVTKQCKISCAAGSIGTPVTRTCTRLNTASTVGVWASATSFPACRKDVCTTSYCKNGGKCSTINNAASCTCPSGWTGSTCTVPLQCPALVLTSTQLPYRHNCTKSSLRTTCFVSCPLGLSGQTVYRTCGQSGGAAVWTQSNAWPVCTSACAPNPCKNGATCTVSGSSPKCQCPRGWTGSLCDIPLPARFAFGLPGIWNSDSTATIEKLGMTGSALISACATRCYRGSTPCMAISVATSSGECRLHRTKRGTAVLSALSSTYYFEREASASSTSDLWNEFAAGNTQRIADFSYAGYNMGSQDPPIVQENSPGWNLFPVTCGHDGYCENGLQSAINLASAAGGGIVKLPAGTWKLRALRPDSTAQSILISSSNIIIRGAGSDCTKACTTLYLETAVGSLNYWYIRAKPAKFSGGTFVNTTSAPMGSRTVTVSGDISRYKPGTFVRMTASHNNPTFLFGNRPLHNDWDSRKSVTVQELHTIRSVDASSRTITFYEPINVKFPPVSIGLNIWRPLENVGFENMVITSAWKTHPAQFVHHASATVDYGWNALHYHHVRNSWIRNIVFDSLNSVARLDTCLNCVVVNNQLVGKQGHAGFLSLRGYGNLIRDNIDRIDVGQFHGPGVQSQDSTTVILRNVVVAGARMESHSDLPQTTLVDCQIGGRLFGFGGEIADLPHHANRYTVWNMKHQGGVYHSYFYNFWPATANVPRQDIIMNNPVIVGIHGDLGIGANLSTLLASESWGVPVLPASLYEAQLLRRGVQIPWAMAQSPRRRQTSDDIHLLLDVVDGGFSDWTPWSECTGACGNMSAMATRSRACDNPPPHNGGQMCDGEYVESIPCTAFATCQQSIDGQWSDWGPWSSCAGQCSSNEGVQTRIRTCDSPAPSGGGADCVGLNTDTSSCSTDDCGLCLCTDWNPAGPCGMLEGGLQPWERACFPTKPQTLRADTMSQCITRSSDNTLELSSCFPVTQGKHVYLEVPFLSELGHVSGNNVLRYGEMCVDVGDFLDSPNSPVSLAPCSAATNNPGMYFVHTAEGYLVPALVDSTWCLDICPSCSVPVVANPCDLAVHRVMVFEEHVNSAGVNITSCRDYPTSKNVLACIADNTLVSV